MNNIDKQYTDLLQDILDNGVTKQDRTAFVFNFFKIPNKTREPYSLPTVKISDRVVNDISEYTLDDIILENYQSHPVIKMPLSN